MSRWIAKTCDLQTCLMLRRVVFIEEQNVPESDEIDDLDAGAIHLLAFENDEPVGTARIVVAGDTGKIGRVCVLRAHRGAGIGADLIKAALDQMRAIEGLTKAKLGAQVDAAGFYQGLGFAAFGDQYMDAGIPHIDMERAL
jgi:ElaA protein